MASINVKKIAIANQTRLCVNNKVLLASGIPTLNPIKEFSRKAKNGSRVKVGFAKSTKHPQKIVPNPTLKLPIAKVKWLKLD